MDYSSEQTVIGYIAKADGTVVVVDENGNRRIADIGDPLYLNEKVVNDSEVNVLIELINNQVLNLISHQQVVMKIDLLKSTASGSSEEQSDDDPDNNYGQVRESINSPEAEKEFIPENDGDEEQTELDKPVEDTFAREAIVDHLDQADRDNNIDENGKESEDQRSDFSEKRQQVIDNEPEFIETPPPQARDFALTIQEDSSFSFNGVQFSSDFTIQSIKIVSTPQQGRLKLNDVDVLPGQQIPVQGLAGLTYQPDPDEHGIGYSSFQFKVSDGSKESSVQQVTFNVTPANDAPVIEDQSFTVNENVLIDGSITPGIVTASDSDSDTEQSLAYSIISGNEDGRFEIDSSTGEISVIDTLDYEVRDSYSLTIQAMDNGAGALSDTATITIDINDLNEAPTVAVPASALYTEGDGDLSVLSALTLSDPEGTLEGATIQFSEHNSQNHVAEDKLDFIDQNGITGSYDAANGVLTLTGTASITDYQAALRSITYTNLSDAPDTDDRILSVTVNDGFIESNVANTTLSIASVNDGPVITGAGNLVDETMDTANQEGLAQHIQIVKAAGSHSFSVGEKIELTFTNSEDSSESYTVTYTINDTAAHRIAAGLTHAILNSTPGIGNHVSVVSEGGSVIGSQYRNVIGFDDPNLPEFNLTTVIKDASDQVVSNDTVMMQNTTSVYGVNYNGGGTTGTAQVETLVIPAGLQAGQTVKLFINDLEVSHTVAAGESVTDIRDALLNQFSNFDISQAVTAVANASDRISLTAVAPGEPFDAYGVTTAASDLFILAVDENTVSGAVVGTVGASDRDGDSDTLTYALTDSAGGRFTINSSTGEITVVGALDHEGAASHTVTVSVTDSQGASSQQQMTIQVGDVNESPLDIALTADAGAMPSIPDPQAAWEFDNNYNSEEGGSSFSGASPTFTTGPNSRFDTAIEFDGTASSFNAPLDVSETAYTVSFWFKADNAGGLLQIEGSGHDRNIYLNADGTITSRVFNDESITSSVGEVYNDGQWHHVVHTFGGAVGGQVLYVDGGQVASGAKTASDFDWQTHIRLGFSDSGNTHLDGAIAGLQVFDEAVTASQIPDLLAGATGADAIIDETSTTAVSIGTLTVSDQDNAAEAFGQHSYAVSDNRFEVVAGELRLKAGQALDYETEPTISVTVTATDDNGSGLSSNRTFTIQVRDNNEAPTVADQTITINEDSNYALTSADFSITDPDAGDTHSITITGINGAGTLMKKPRPDLELLFEDDSTATSAFDSRNDIRGNLTGVTWGTDAEKGGIVTFDQNSDRINLTQAYDLGNEWTITTEFRNLRSDGTSWQSLVEGNGDVQILINNTTGEIGTWQNDVGFHGAGFNVSNLGSDWHSLTAVGRDGKTHFYMDGEFLGTANYQSTGIIDTVGNNGHVNSQAFADELNDFRIYNTAQLPDLDLLTIDEANTPELSLTFTDQNDPVNDAGNNIHGTMTSGVQWQDDSEQGPVLRFDDTNDYLTLDSTYDVGSEWTMSVRFKNPDPVDSGHISLLTRGTGSDGHVAISSSGELGVYDRLPSNTFIGSGYTITDLDDDWHTLVAVGVGSKTEFYIDGQHVGTADFQVTDNIDTIGGHSSSPYVNPFAEFIDDFQVYDQAFFGDLPEIPLGSAEVNTNDVIAEEDLADLIFVPDAHTSGDAAASIDFRATDSGGLESSVETLTFNVTPVTDTPVITLNNDTYGDLLLDTELITNGDFASGANEWTLTGNVVDFNGPQSSNNAVMAFGGGNGANDGVIEQSFIIHPDVHYSLALDYRAGWADSLQSGLVEIIDITTGEILASQVFSSNTQIFQSLNLSFTGVANGQATLRITNTSVITNSVDLFVDNISIAAASVDNSHIATGVGVFAQEDQPIAVNLTAVTPDTDGSETLAIELTGIPSDIQLTDGTHTFISTGAAIDVSNWNLASLELTTSANNHDDFTFTVSATATETATGTSETTSQAIHVHIQSVNDAPTAASTTLSINEDSSYSFTAADFSISDPDVGDTHTITITGINGLIGIPAETDPGLSLAFTDQNDPVNYAANNIQGTAASGVQWQNDPDQGPVMRFDNTNDYLTLDSNHAVGNEWTMSVRFKNPDPINDHQVSLLTRTTGHGDGHIAINSNGELGVFERFPAAGHSGDVVEFEGNINDGAFYGSGYIVTDLDSDWHTMIAVGEGGNTTFYIDGQYVGVSDFQVTDEIASIGGNVSAFDPFAEFIDDFQVYDGNVISTPEIRLGTTEININDTIAAEDIDNLVFVPVNHISGDAAASINYKVTDSGGLESSIETLTFDISPVTDSSVITLNNDSILDIDVVQNGDISTTDNWTTSGAISLTNSRLQLGAGSANSDGVAEQQISLNENLTYSLSLDYFRIGQALPESALIEVIDSATGSTLFSESISTNSGTTQTLNADFTTTTSGNAILRISDTSSGSRPSTDLAIDNISIIPLASNNTGHTPSVSVPEDQPIAVDLSIVNPDMDGSETLAIELTGIPLGIELSDGNNTLISAGAAIDVSNWSLGNLVLTAPENYDTDFTITATATATETATSATEVTSQDINIQIQSINDAPELDDLSSIDNGYTFSEGSGSTAADTTDNNQDATLSGSATWGTGRGGTGSAFEMDGTSGAGEISGLTTGGAMTIAAWVRFDSFSQSWSRIIDFGDGANDNNILLGHVTNTNDLGFHVHDSSGTQHDLNISNFFTAGEWVHVAVTIDSSGLYTVYKNGAEAGSLQGGVPTEKVRNFNYIGKSNWSTDGYLDGAIDDLRVINESLSATEISGLYQRTDALMEVDEYSADNTVVGTVSATDVDTSDTLTYSLVDDAGGRFAIDSSTGEVTVANGSLLDFDDHVAHTIRVRVTDDGNPSLNDEKDVIIAVNNINAAPTSADKTLTINEDNSHTFVTTDFAFSDLDDTDSLQSIKITSLPAAGSLQLNNVDVTLDQIITAADIPNLVFTPAANAHGTGYSDFQFRVSDGSQESTDQTMIFNVTAANDAPVIDELTISDVLSNVDINAGYAFSEGSGSQAADISNSGQAMTFSGSPSWVTGRTGSGYALELDGSSDFGEITGLETGGAMTVAAWVEFDSTGGWERIIDFGNGAANHNILIGSPPTVTDGLGIRIFHGNQVIGTLDVADVVQVGQWAHVAFTIDDVGDITLYVDGTEVGSATMTTNAPPDVMVRSNNLVGSDNWGATQSLDGRLDDLVILNEALDATQVNNLAQAAPFSDVVLDIDEHSADNSVVGTVAATDVDTSDTITYTLLDDAGGRFSINSSTGEVTVADGSLLDFDDNTSHKIRVQVTDDGTPSLNDEKEVTIVVNNINNAPTLSTTLDTATSTEQHINTVTAGSQQAPALTAMPDGGFLAVWQDVGSDEIKAQRYNYTETRSVTIADHSFESVTYADGGYSQLPADSAWNFNGVGDTWNPMAVSMTSEASDGDNVVYIDSGTASQTLTEILSRDTTYQLQVDVGNRSDTVGFANYAVRITAGGIVLATNGSVSPAEGQWETLTLDLDGSAIAENSAALGQPITIELVHISGPQMHFDNVRMTVTEPSVELNPIGDEFQINTTVPASNQDVRTPVVATLDNGNYAVVWDLIQPGSWIQSHMRVFDANGNEVKAEFNLGTSHYATEITALTNNRFATVSIDSSDSFNAKVHIFDASGNETAVVTAGSAGNWGYGAPDIDALDNGGFVVAWRSDATSNNSAAFQIFDASGTATSSVISFGGSNPSNYREVEMQVLESGELVSLYQAGDDIYFQRWSSTGTAIGSAVMVNTTTADTQSQFSIEALADGGFFVIWKSSGGQDGDGQGVFGRRFDASGNAITDEIAINNTTSGEQFDPQLVQLTNGALQALWTSDQDGDNEIYGNTIGLGGGTGANQVQENAINGTLVGKAAVSDVDDPDTHTYTLLNDAGGRFAIDSNTGNIAVADGTLLDHETNDSHTIRVRVTDNGGLSSEQDIVIQVQDINEAPDVSGAITATVPENLEAHTVTQAFLLTNATDVDDGDTLSVQDVSVNGVTAHRHDFQTSFAAGTGGNVSVNGNTLTLTSALGEENVVLIDTTGGSTRGNDLHLDFTAAPTDGHTTRNNFIVFDYVDANNYKAIGSYDGDDSAHWVVEHWVNGANTRLAEYNSSDNSNINVDRHYEVDIINNRVTLTVDGVEKVAHQFSENISDGQLGVMNRGNAVSTYTLNGANWDIYPDNQHAVYDNNDGTWTILPGDDLSGDLTLAYNVSDGQLTTAATAVIPVNRTPDATIELSSTSGISDDVLSVETTAQGDSLTVTSVNGQTVASSGTTSITGEYGTLDIAADGSWNYNLNSNYASVDLDSDLIAEWNFDGNANDNAPSDSIADDGVLQGNAAYTSDSVSGSAVTLDGTGDYVQIATTTELGNYSGTVGQRTISLFFKLDPSNSKGGKQVLYEEGGSSHGFAIYLDGGKIYVGGWENSNTAYVSKDITYLDSENWHHIALRMDDANNTLRGFLDGEKFGQGAAGIQVPAHTGTVAFGGPSEGNQAFDFHDLDDGVGTQFNGLIDEGRVYNRALTGREIDVLGNLDQTETFSYDISDGTHTSTATLDINVLHTLDSTSGLDGSAAGETLTGSLFAEQIDGMAGNDTLLGNGGNDILIGGLGDDILTGGDGEDIFDFDFSHIGTAASPAQDTITDFNISEGDVLDIRDLLVDEENNDLTQYLSFDQTDASNPILEIRDTADGDITQKVTLQGVDLSSLGSTDAEIINSLLNNGNLNTDQ